MSDDWDIYFANVNDVLASLRVDLGIRDSVPDPDRSWLLWIWVHFQHPRDDGLYGPEEIEALDAIEDALASKVKENTEAELVGCITTAGRREFYFYGAAPDRFEEAVASAMKNFPNYEFDSGTQHDPEWSQYLEVLFPSDEDFQRMQNRHVVESLEKHGDPLTKSRPVSHWAYFQSQEDRDQFIAKAVNAGFTVIDQSEGDNSEEEYPYGVTLERVDFVDWDSINEPTLELFRLARDIGGNYDGWETSVEKEEKEEG